MNLGDTSNNPNLHIGEMSKVQSISWGFVVNVNPEEQTMRVSLPDQDYLVTDAIAINNMITYGGAGVRMMPVAGHTVVVLLKLEMKYVHIGYALENMQKFTEDKFGTKSATLILQRYLEEGEVQLVGLNQNEILLDNSGSILLKTTDNKYLKLDNETDSLDALFRSMKFELDGVRVRGGQARRSLKGYGREDVSMVIDENEEVKTSTDLVEDEEGNLEPYIPIQEFTVSVGVQKDENGLDLDPNLKDPSGSSPSVGIMSMSNRVLKEDGTSMKILGKNVTFIVKLADGGGFAVTEDNSAYILDYRGRNFTKFSSGSETKSLRAGDNNFFEASASGMKIQHESGMAMDIKSDADGEPEFFLTHKDGRGMIINKMGFAINMDGSYITLTGKEIHLNAEKVTFGGILAAATGDTILKAKLTAALLDTHIHAGPAGPPMVPLTPLVLSGAICGFGFNVG